MRRLLITGGTGFIGTNFVHYWLARYPLDRVVVLDALTYAANINNLAFALDKENFRFVKGNICDTELVERLLQEERLDTIVHFAAESHVDRSISAPDLFIQTNVIGTHSLLKAARKIWLVDRVNPVAHHFHHVSTDEVYGSLAPDAPAFSESTPYAPSSPYSASKAASDHLVRSYHQTYGLNVTISNCSNNFGYYQFPEKLIPLVLANILHGKYLPIYGDGKQVRDWLFVEDHCLGIDLVLQKGQVGETYNLGAQNEYANINIVNLLCELMDEAFVADPMLARRFPDSPCSKGVSSKVLIQHVTDRLGHDRRYAIDCTKSERELGFKPCDAFDSAIRKTVRWYLEHYQQDREAL